MNNIRVFDFSVRLPGPLACHILATKGFKTFKIENKNYRDPFRDNQLEQSDPIFKFWYDNINSNKEFFEGDSNQVQSFVRANLNEINIFIGLAKAKVKKILGELPNHCKYVFIEIIAGEGADKYMHDLNAIAATPIFKLHLKQSQDPPFAPVAAVTFAQDIANEALLGVLELTENKSEIFRTASLKVATSTLYNPLWDESLGIDNKFLHSGKYPCYRLYKARDCMVAVAAIEEKFWKKFVESFNLPLTMDDRLNSSSDIASIIENKLAEYQRQDLVTMANSQMCLTII